MCAIYRGTHPQVSVRDFGVSAFHNILIERHNLLTASTQEVGRLRGESTAAPSCIVPSLRPYKI